MTILCTTAVLTDLYNGKIYNGLIITGLLFGLLYQLFENGIMGFILSLGGILMPVVLLGSFFFFRMIGAGDIKLLCVLGGFVGPGGGWDIIVYSVIWGGILSIVLMVLRKSCVDRLLYFTDYVSSYAENGKWHSYLEGTKEKDRFCFSIPILIGLVWYIGGIV